MALLKKLLENFAVRVIMQLQTKGKILYEYSLIEDQKHILNQITNILNQH